MTSLAAAHATAASMIAFQMAGRATRDALFLSNYPSTALPPMVAATSVLSVAIAYASTRAFTRWGPERVMPVAFAASAALLLAEWGTALALPQLGSVLLYLHFGSLSALLISGFWSFMNERLDPRSAKRQLGRIAASGTIGGLVGGLAALQVGRALPVAAMFPALAAFHLVCGFAMTRLRLPGGAHGAALHGGGGRTPIASAARTSGLRAVASTPYIRGLISLVLLVTISEGLIDLALKGRAFATLGPGGGLLSFFATFYTGMALLTVIVQTIASRFVLEKLGPARSAGVLPAGMALAATGAAIIPGLPSVAVARGADSVLSNSLYRAGYEVLFTPVPASEKRAIKSLVDVGASRTGDFLAAGIAQGVVMLAMPMQGTALLLGAIVLAAAAAIIAWRLHSGYIDALARGLVTRAVQLDLHTVQDGVTRSTLLQTLGPLASGDTWKGSSDEREATAELIRIRDFHSHDPDRARRALRSGSIPTHMVEHVIPLLANDDVARDVITALRRTGSDAAEPLIRRLLDPGTDFTIRRRIPLVLGTIVEQRVVDGLLRATMDPRFEVRYRAGRALAHLLELNPSLQVSRADVFASVLNEVDLAAGVWKGRDLLDRMDDEGWSPVLGELVRDRADRSLEHVFTLLALVMPREPLRIAFRGLHTDDPQLRGTALEYLDTTLPPLIRKTLWPFLEDNRPKGAAPPRPTEKALEDLFRSSDSIVIKLDELRKKEAERPKEG